MSKTTYVPRPIYYTWERVYLAEVSRQLAIPERLSEQAGRLVRIDPDQLPDEMERGTPALPVQTTFNVGITLRCGNMSVEMPAGMEIEQVAELMKAVARLAMRKDRRSKLLDQFIGRHILHAERVHQCRTDTSAKAGGRTLILRLPSD